MALGHLGPKTSAEMNTSSIFHLKKFMKDWLSMSPLTRSRQSFPGDREIFLHAKMVQKGGPHKKINDKKNNAPFAPKKFLTREICLENRVPSIGF